MNLVGTLNRTYNNLFSKISFADGLGPLALRVYLFFPFYMAGSNKLADIESTAYWFGEHLGFPLPTLMAYLAAYTEFLGAFLLLFGLATRLISIPLIITMIVAAFSVHWDNGWYAIAQSSDPEVGSRLDAARSILQEHGNYDWLTGKGSFVILNNGIEFAITYLIMLMVLVFTGGGRFFSADYYVQAMLGDKDSE
ncbi:DoxX family protein [Pleionea sp. CnH1-48]|uniref:HvfX family Cu-binding RiPP maturation protein n=1 Tax=Pleionea sp. CnH1-48 TaxID=2954494 RepID=UPI0020974657|nr:DoxX family protein [Pleionea sp. CnH1-48]MCO7224624.1 DoxX family protein [Pleionea sp. CnH1-48]